MTRPLPAPYAKALRMANARTTASLKTQRDNVSNRLRLIGLTGNNPPSTADIRRARQVMLGAQRSVWRDAARAVQLSRYDAASAAVEVHGLAPVLRQTAYEQARASGYDLGQANRVVRSAANRTTKWLNKLVGDLARSDLSAAQVRKELVDWINPNVPGGLSYAADRLVENELSETFHNAQIASAEVQGIETVFWELDPGHEGEDECDDYDGQEFPVDEVPDRPHIGCNCHLVPGMRTGDEEVA